MPLVLNDKLSSGRGTLCQAEEQSIQMVEDEKHPEGMQEMVGGGLGQVTPFTNKALDTVRELAPEAGGHF